MRRDFNLIRSLLLEIESLDLQDSREGLEAWSRDKCLDSKLRGHLELMIDRRLISGVTMSQGNKIYAIGRLEITFKGHDFLAVARNQEHWDGLMKATDDGSVSFDLLCSFLQKLILETA
jgi:Hypothetical protein (DUF2513)